MQTWSRSWTIGCGLLLFHLLRLSTCDAADFPFSTTITTDQAAAWSGPGQAQDYKTERLDQGQQVEVYQEQAGWLAIRPTPAAFSWVAGRSIEQVDQQTGRIIKDRTPALIGSQLTSRRDRQVVELKQGELVEIIERVQIDNDYWYKVAPPAGEFRWIKSSDTQRAIAAGSVTGTSNSTTTNSPPTPGVISQWQPADASRWRNLEPGSIGGPTSTIVASPARQPFITEPINTAPIAQPTPVAMLQPTSTAVVTANPLPIAPQPSNAATSDQLAGVNPLDQLEVDLAAMIVQEPATWNTLPLNQRAERLFDQSQSAVERGKIRIYQGKLARFNEIKQKSIEQQAILASRGQTWSATPTAASQIARTSPFPLPNRSSDWIPGIPRTTLPLAKQAAMASPVGLAAQGAATANSTLGSPIPNPLNSTLPSTNLAPLATLPSGTNNASIETDLGRYDSIGKLMPVQSQRTNAPKFALLDANNKVLTFITPAPGVDLQSFVGMQVGVAGSRELIVDLNKPHITANKVGPTDPAVIARLRSENRLR